MKLPQSRRPHATFSLVTCAGVVATACALIATRTAPAEEPSAASQPILLRYQFHEGQIVQYDVTINDDYHIQVGTATDDPYSHQQSTKHYRVVKVHPDGSATIELEIDWILLEINQNDGVFKYNSENRNPAGQPAFLAVDALVGKPHLQLTITPSGAVTDINPLVPQDQVQKDPAQTAYDVLLHLPEEPVKVGSTWKEDLEIQIRLPGAGLQRPVKVQRRYTLKSLDQGRATIDFQTKVISIINDPEEEMQLIRRTPCGTIVLDLEKGLLVSKSFTQNNRVSGFQMGAAVMEFKQLHTEKLRENQTAAQAEAQQTTTRQN